MVLYNLPHLKPEFFHLKPNNLAKIDFIEKSSKIDHANIQDDSLCSISKYLNFLKSLQTESNFQPHSFICPEKEKYIAFLNSWFKEYTLFDARLLQSMEFYEGMSNNEKLAFFGILRRAPADLLYPFIIFESPIPSFLSNVYSDLKECENFRDFSLKSSNNTLYQYIKSISYPIMPHIRKVIEISLNNWYDGQSKRHLLLELAHFELLRVIKDSKLFTNFQHFLNNSPMNVIEVFHNRTYLKLLSHIKTSILQTEFYEFLSTYLEKFENLLPILKVLLRYPMLNMSILILSAFFLSEAIISGLPIESLIKYIEDRKKIFAKNVIEYYFHMFELALGLVNGWKSNSSHSSTHLILKNAFIDIFKDTSAYFNVIQAIESFDICNLNFKETYFSSLRILGMCSVEPIDFDNNQFLFPREIYTSTASKPSLFNLEFGSNECIFQFVESDRDFGIEKGRQYLSHIDQNFSSSWGQVLTASKILQHFKIKCPKIIYEEIFWNIYQKVFGKSSTESYISKCSMHNEILGLYEIENFKSKSGIPYERIIQHYDEIISKKQTQSALISLARYIDNLIHFHDGNSVDLWKKCANSYLIASTMCSSLDCPLIVRYMTLILEIFKKSPSSLISFISESNLLLPLVVKHQIRSAIFYLCALSKFKSSIIVNLCGLLLNSIIEIYPHTIFWYGLYSQKSPNGHSFISNLVSASVSLYGLWSNYIIFADDISNLGKEKESEYVEWLSSRKSINMTICVPSMKNLSLKQEIFDEIGFEYISGFCCFYEIMKSLQKPVKIWISTSAGTKKPFLCKYNDELRKDNRFLDYLAHFELLSASKYPKEVLKVYAAIPLTESSGIIEWVEGTETFRSIIHKMIRKKKGVEIDMQRSRTILASGFEGFRQLLSTYTPVFNIFFNEQFLTVSEWFEAKQKFVASVAITSVLGFCVGLGDRHTENILINTETGGVIHVDFSCLFDRAKSFEVPEVVPFRLTQNMTSVIGSYGQIDSLVEHGILVSTLIRKHAIDLSGLLDSLIYDPILEWKKTSAKYNDESSHRLFVLNRMQGQYDHVNHTNSDHVYFGELVKAALDQKNLSKMYFGWAPFI